MDADSDSQPHEVAPPEPQSSKIFSGMVISVTNGNTGALKRKDIAAIITQHGGKVSPTVHKRVTFLIADPAAIRQNTQRVRKARKFGCQIVGAEFVEACVREGRLVESSDYALAQAKGEAGELDSKKKEKKKKIKKKSSSSP